MKLTKDIFTYHKIISKKDKDFLYSMLKERGKKINISHKKMPSKKEHYRFIDNRPYYLWKIIKCGNKKIGNFYISYNMEIGIFIKKSEQGKGFGSIVLDDILSYARMSNIKTLFANINPVNDKSKILFNSKGFEKIQNTYRLK